MNQINVEPTISKFDKMGAIIAIEGFNEQEKDIQSDLLISNLESDGYIVHHFSFPSHGDTGKTIMNVNVFNNYNDWLTPIQIANMFLVDITHSVSSIKKSISDGEIVVITSYIGTIISRVAPYLPDASYFSFYNELKKIIDQIENLAYNILSIPRPDIVFHFDGSQDDTIEDAKNNKGFYLSNDPSYIKEEASASRTISQLKKWKDIDSIHEDPNNTAAMVYEIFKNCINLDNKYFNFTKK